jgi:hypothetical protein
LFEPGQPDDPRVELPWDLGKVPPHIFYIVAVLLLSIILTAFSSAHAQMVRAHRLSNEALSANGKPVLAAIDMRDVVDVLRLSSFLRLAPLAQVIRGGKRQFFHQPAPSRFVAWVSAVHYAVLKGFGGFVYFAFPAAALGFTWRKFETTPEAIAAAGRFFTWGVRVLSVSALVAILIVMLVEIWHTLQVFLRIGEQRRQPSSNSCSSGLQQTPPSQLTPIAPQALAAHSRGPMNEDRSSRSNTEPVDSAALAGATMAAVLAVVIPVGPFDVFSIPVGIALFLVILAHEGARRRDSRARRLSFAASTAFALVLVVGPLIELFLHGCDTAIFLKGGAETDGRVEPWMNAASWLAISTCVLGIDSFWQRKRHSSG